LTDQFVDDILEESSRIEADQNTSSGNPEITAAIIKDAHDYIRKFHIKPKKEKWVGWVQIVAFFATIITGGMFSKADLSNTGELVLFLIIFFIAGGSSTILTFKEFRK
jgi:hypothetical protein